MRVNLVIPRLPLPFSGSDSRWHHVLASQLPRLGVELTVVALHEGDHRAESDAHAHALRWDYKLRVVHVAPRQGVSARVIRLALPRTEFAQSADVRDAIRLLRRDGKPTVLSGITAPGLAGQLDEAVAELHYLQTVDRRGEPWTPSGALPRIQDQRAERRFLKEAPPLIVNSPRMAAIVSKWRPPVATTKLTLDADLYQFTRKAPELTLGYIGSMFWAPSRRAAERLLLRVWPLVRAEVPGARLLVAGWRVDEYLGRFFPIEGAELISSVVHAEDFYRRLTVLLFPPVGGTGMKIKTLEAMAYGVPVVTTAEGVEGLEDVDGAPPSLADDDRALADAAVGLLGNAALRRDLAESGRAAFERDLHPRRASEAFLAAALQAVGGSAG